MSRGALLLTLLAAGCARTLPSPPVAPTSPPPPTAVAWIPDRFPTAHGVEPDGLTRVLWQGARLALRDEVVRFAPEALDDAIRHAVPAARGWVFITRRGAVLTAETFLGPFTLRAPRGAVALDDLGVARVVHGQRQRVAFASRDGQAWTTDGGPLVALPALRRRVAVLVAFRDAAHGAAVTEGGALWHSRDGGETWTFVPTQGLAIASLRIDDDTLRVALDHAHEISDAGRLVSRPGDREIEQNAFEVPAEWQESLVAQGPVWRDVFAVLPRRDGTELVTDVRVVRVVDRDRGETLRTFAPHPVCTPATAEPLLRYTCYDHTARCGWGRRDAEVWVDPCAPERELGDPLPALRVALGSDDGMRSVARGRCDGPLEAFPTMPEDPLPRALCVITDARAEPETREVASPLRALVGVWAGRAWVLRDDHTLATVALDGDAPLALTPQWHLPDHTLTAAVSSNGTVTALARGADEFRAWVATPDHNGGEVPLPPDVDRAVFVDARRGFAWRGDLRAIARTRDRGAHWEPLPTPCALDTAPRDVEVRPSPPDALRCSPSRCLLEGRYAVAGWGPVSPPPICVSTGPEDTHAVTVAEGWLTPEQIEAPRCTAFGPRRPRPRWPSLPAHARAAGGGTSTETADGDLRLVAWPDPFGGITMRLAWRVGEAGQERMRVSADWPIVNGLAEDVTTGGAFRLAALSLKEGNARVWVGVDGGTGVVHNVVLTASPTEVRWLRDEAGDRESFSVVRGATVLSRWGLDVTAQEDDDPPRRREVDPRVRAAVDHVPHEERALAWRGDRHGVVVLSALPHTARVFPLTPSTDAPPEEVPWRPTARLPWCRHPREDAWSLALQRSYDTEVETLTYVELETASEGVCVRGATWRGPTGLRTVRSDDRGRLSGEDRNTVARTALRCGLP